MGSPSEFLLVTLFFTVLTVLMTWPVAYHLRRLIPTSPPDFDALSEYYAIAWGQRALRLQPFRYFDVPSFYPYAGALAFMEHLFGLVLLALPFMAALGTVAAGYNVVWLLTFVVSALGVYQLTRSLSGSRPAGLLAGVVFAFHPFRYHNAGQVNVLAMMWIPWALLLLFLWRERGRRGYLLAFAGLLLLQFLSSAYTLVFLMLASAIVLWPDRRRLWAERVTVVVLAAGSALLALPFVLPYVRMALGEARFSRRIGETALYSAHWIDFLTPAPRSFTGALSPWKGVAHHALFPGFVAALFATLGVRRSGLFGRTTFLFLAGIAFVLSLGPIVPDLPVRIPLPFALAWFTVPGMAIIRAPVRFVILSSLGLSVLAGFGLAGWADRLRGGGRFLAYAPAILAALELSAAPVFLIDPVEGHDDPVYARVRDLPPGAIIAEVPVAPDEFHEVALDARYQIYGLEHGHRLVNGFGAFLPPRTRMIRQALGTFPDDKSLAELRSVGVTHVVVHFDRLPPGDAGRIESGLRDRTDMATVSGEGPVRLYEIQDPGR